MSTDLDPADIAEFSIFDTNGGKTELALEDVELALNSVPWVADLRTHY